MLALSIERAPTAGKLDDSSLSAVICLFGLLMGPVDFRPAASAESSRLERRSRGF